jgi:hypothetical protein
MPAPKNNKNASKPGTETRLSIRFTKQETELLTLAWRLDTNEETPFHPWLISITKNAPLLRAKFLVGLSEEDEASEFNT